MILKSEKGNVEIKPDSEWRLFTWRKFKPSVYHVSVTRTWSNHAELVSGCTHRFFFFVVG